MFRRAAATGALLAVALAVPAATGEAQTADGRFQLTAEGDGFLRLDTQTGALSFCQLTGGRWTCEPVPVNAGPTVDLTPLTDRLAALEGAVAALTAEIENGGANEAIQAQLQALSDQLADLAGQQAALAAASEPALTATLDQLAAQQAALADAVAALAARPDNTQMLADLEALTGASRRWRRPSKPFRPFPLPAIPVARLRLLLLTSQRCATRSPPFPRAIMVIWRE